MAQPDDPLYQEIASRPVDDLSAYLLRVVATAETGDVMADIAACNDLANRLEEPKYLPEMLEWCDAFDLAIGVCIATGRTRFVEFFTRSADRVGLTLLMFYPPTPAQEIAYNRLMPISGKAHYQGVEYVAFDPVNRRTEEELIRDADPFDLKPRDDFELRSMAYALPDGHPIRELLTGSDANRANDLWSKPFLQMRMGDDDKAQEAYVVAFKELIENATAMLSDPNGPEAVEFLSAVICIEEVAQSLVAAGAMGGPHEKRVADRALEMIGRSVSAVTMALPFALFSPEHRTMWNDGTVVSGKHRVLLPGVEMTAAKLQEIVTWATDGAAEFPSIVQLPRPDFGPGGPAGPS